MYRFIIFWLLIIVNFNVCAQERFEAVKVYVDQLSYKVSDILNDKSVSEDAKIAKCKDLIAANVDLDWMAKYTLGRYRRQFSERQIREFSEVYANYVVKAYSNMVKSYKGEHADIKNIQPISDNEFIVKTELISKTGNPPIKVDYFVRDISNTKVSSLKIVDIITEGVSMINSQQSEFVSIIAASGFDALIEALQKKV